MRFYRLVKPIWSIPKKANGDSNPKFEEEIQGPNIVEGVDFSPEYLKQKNEVGYSIYYFPNHPKVNPYNDEVRYLNGRLIEDFTFIFADVDFKDGIYKSISDVTAELGDFPMEPTLTVSSGNGVHIYFKIRDLNRGAYVALQLKLIKHFKSDPSVFTVLQLLRLPGYLNTKKFGNFIPCDIIPELSSKKDYTISEMMRCLPDLSDEEKQRGRNHLDRLDGKLTVKLMRDVNVDELPDKFLKLMMEKDHIAKIYDDPNARGDRSAADMTLGHFLYSEKFNYQEVLAVIANSQKGLEKGVSRMEYAKLTVDKVFDSRKTKTIQTVGEFLRDDMEVALSDPVNGPSYLDTGVLGNVWRKTNLLGIISGSGVGKTSVALNIIKDTIENNKSEEVFVFFSLEMPKSEIIARWVSMVGKGSPLCEQLYVVDTEDGDGGQRLMGLQEIHQACLEIKQQTGRNIGALVIDHLLIISTHIKVKQHPNFAIEAEGGTGYGDTQNLTYNQLATQLKTLAKMLDTFIIVSTQTTKEKGGKGDLPLDKNACYGCSQYAWICDFILTIFQPLARVQSETDLRALAFQYTKIRHKHVEDRIREYEPKLLTFNMSKETLQYMNAGEYQEFLRCLPLAKRQREIEAKKEAGHFSVAQ